MVNKYELQQTVGRNLRRCRANARLTQKQLAEKAGISVSRYANLERGKSMMDIAVLCALSDALMVTPEGLLHGDVPSIHIQSICALLRAQPEPFVIEIEHFIRIVLKNFSLGARIEIPH